MESRWSEEAAAGLDPLGLLVYRSNLLGADPAVVNRGGGNTSVKRTVRDFRGAEVEVLTVKASGYDLRTIGPGGFCDVRLSDVAPLRQRAAMTDEEMVAYLVHCLLDPAAPRPSIETLLHAFLPATHVDHTHAEAVNALSTAERGETVTRELFGADAIWVPYQRPGFALSRLVGAAVEAAPDAKWLVLEHHGLVTWGDTAAACYARNVEFLGRAAEYLRRREAERRVFVAVTPTLPPADRRAAYARLAPGLRAALCVERRMVLHFDDAPDVLEFVNAAEAPELAAAGLACPDHVLSTGVRPLLIPADPAGSPDAFLRQTHAALDAYEAEYRRFYERHTDGSHPMMEPRPRILLVPGLGMITAGRDKAGALVTADTYRRAIAMMRGATLTSRFTPLSPRDTYDVEYWPLELYKLTLRPPERELARRVALITGGAGAIGRAVAARFAREGAQVVIADLDGERAAAAADEIGRVSGALGVLAVQCDVTDEGSVVAAFEATVQEFGGLDILVANAGYASSYPLEDLSLDEWRRTFAVLSDGYFTVSREALRVIKRQRRSDGATLGGSIVFVASKAGLVPARNAAAYASAKAAELHLARCIAEEAGPFGVRVNSLAPDAIIAGSGLWAGQWGQARAAAHGVPLDGLEEFYRRRNMLKLSVTADDVAEAALFFAISALGIGVTLLPQAVSLYLFNIRVPHVGPVTQAV
ncbi:MAG: bifunctional rhamnulose-1-phosphate aldolase/short-chain dehydrogenase, partial [Chloroflexi bacterium]|nr:bifunctional rhamnulose-1-phosphate aldolase/short-chain dehydrogenase [Chloroflexota bacterium]